MWCNRQASGLQVSVLTIFSFVCVSIIPPCLASVVENEFNRLLVDHVVFDHLQPTGNVEPHLFSSNSTVCAVFLSLLYTTTETLALNK